MKRLQDDKIVNLESDGATTVVVRYRGVLMSLTKERIVQMLRREEAYLSGEAAPDDPGDEPAEAKAAPPAPKRRSELPILRPTGAINHAGLSVRIKRMYHYNIAARVLRPAHAEHLPIILASFDGNIPEHPNTQLDFQLREIAGWGGVSAALRAQIDEFLRNYQDRRYRSAV